MFCKTNIKLSQYTTFKIGGAADYFFVARNKDDLIEALRWAKEKNIPIFVLGGGSNILIPDDGVRGLVIKIEFDDILIAEDKMTVQSGCQLSKAVNFAYQNSLSGLEWAAGIPGAVGGAIVGNAGAYGSSMADLVVEVEFLDLSGGAADIKNFTKDDCQFAYRESIFKNKKCIILSVVFQLAAKNQSEIKEAMDDYLGKRLQKIPVGNSAGCVFKNIEIDSSGEIVIARRVLTSLPLRRRGRQSGDFINNIPQEFMKYGKIPAAWVIEKCGLKGSTAGDAQISDKHSNFIINNNNAKCEDVIKLIELVEKTAQEKFGIKLEREVIVWYNRPVAL